ncbi:pimeloyl-ACP methyl ester carboxylesterase [Streptomyces sp. SAI-041]|nr:pimeloyl-ACP methyl ester carboxylesterase [Streptomyces sp. SAI-041]
MDAPPGMAERTVRSATRHEGRVAGLYTARFGPWPPRQTVIVMVHGLGLSGRYFTPLARSLAAVGRTVLVPDLPGNVRSRRVVRRTPDVEETTEALLRWQAAAAIGPCLLVANSVGCQVTAALAAEHPRRVERMVLIGPALDATALSPLRQLLRLPADAPKEPLSLLAVAAADYLLTGAARFLAGFRHARLDASGPFEERLRRVEAPTLVLRGAEDRVAPQHWAERVTADLPHGRLAVVPGAAHAVHFSRPDTTARLILDFCREDSCGAAGQEQQGGDAVSGARS